MITPKQKQSLPQSSKAGFTIAESLMAIVVVAILMAAVAPAIGLSVATRVQARRVELGSQAARVYVDGVKAGTIITPSHTIDLQEVNTTTTGTTTTKNFVSDRGDFAGVAVPSSTSGLSCTPPTATTTNYYCANTATSSLYCINGDSDAGCSSNSISDLVVQAFRTQSNINNYILGIRVYRADGFKTSSAFTSEKQQATFSGGLGNPKAPLIQMTTEITNSQPQYQDYCNRLGGCNP